MMKKFKQILLVCLLLIMTFPAVSVDAVSISEPLKIRAIRSNTDRSITLEWYSVVDATGYQIYYAKKGGNYTKLTSVKYKENSYTTKTLTNGVTYQFKIRAYVTKNKKTTFGKFSEVVSAKAAAVKKWKAPGWNGVFKNEDSTCVIKQDAVTGDFTIEGYDRNMTLNLTPFYEPFKPTDIKNDTIAYKTSIYDGTSNGTSITYYCKLEKDTLVYWITSEGKDSSKKVWKRTKDDPKTFDTSQIEVDSPWEKIKGTFQAEDSKKIPFTIKISNVKQTQYSDYIYPCVCFEMKFTDGTELEGSVMHVEAMKQELEVYVSTQNGPGTLKIKLGEDGKTVSAALVLPVNHYPEAVFSKK